MSVSVFNSLPNVEYSNLSIVVAFPKKTFSGKTSLLVKISYLLTLRYSGNTNFIIQKLVIIYRKKLPVTFETIENTLFLQYSSSFFHGFLTF